jgi:hypothetical protein
MFNDDALRPMVHQAIDNHPPRFTRLRPSAPRAEMHRAEGAYRAYLRCIALAIGGHYPTGMSAQEVAAIAAWRALHDALDMVLTEAASTLDEPDYDAALRAVRAVAEARALAPQCLVPRVMTMQERILAALIGVGQRAGRHVNTQPQYANTGHVFYTASYSFAALAQVSYHFDPDRCTLHLRGPAIEALHLTDSPPLFRYEPTESGWQLSFYVLRYADGEQITAMLDLLARALAARTS